MTDAAARYQQLAVDREQFLQRGRANALLTIPSLLPPEGKDKQAHLVEPYQGIGSSGVAHLSSRMTMAFIPAGRPVLRLDLPAQVKMQANGNISTNVERGISLAEGAIQGEIEDIDWRTQTLQSVQQLIVAGNVAEQIMPDNTIRVFRLDSFVVKRNYRGGLLEAVIEEKTSPDALPPWVDYTASDPDEEVCLYCWIKIRKKEGGWVYVVEHWIEGNQVSDPREFSAAGLPYLFLRWSATPGEDYGRAKVSEHIADLRSLENLEKAQLEQAAMASWHAVFIRPGATGVGLKRRLRDSGNGAVLMADPESVEAKSFDNPGGFQITSQQVINLRDSLSRAFLLYSAGQRDAERVTATEIERDIQELEAALGGNFATLNTSMMERRIGVLIPQMIEQGKLPPIIVAMTRPVILTGLEALSRERDVHRVAQLSEIANMMGPDTPQVVLKRNKLMAKAAIGLGFADVVNSDEEMQVAIQQQQAAQMAQAAAGPVAGGLARGDQA